MTDVLQVVRGNPSPEQLAALVVVLAARADGGSPPVRRPRPWSRPARSLRVTMRPGPGGWSASRGPRPGG